MKFGRWLGIAMGATLTLCATHRVASAQPSSDESFATGRKALLAGDYDVACAHFQAGIAAEETPGLRLNLGYCEEKRGRTADAWRQYRRALELLTVDDARRAATEQRRLDLESSSLATVVLVALDGGSIAEASVDGAAMKLGVLDVLVPGIHQVAFSSAANGVVRTLTIVAVAGQSLRIVLDANASGSLVSEEANPAQSAPQQTVIASPQSMKTPTNDGWLQRGFGIGVGGIGLSTAVVGAVFGVRALDKRSESDDRCPVVAGEERCTAAGVRFNEEAKSAALAADVLLGVGAGLVALGIVLVLTAPQASATQSPPLSLSLCPALGGAALSGAFQ